VAGGPVADLIEKLAIADGFLGVARPVAHAGDPGEVVEALADSLAGREPGKASIVEGS
jgi:hypothetical protein